MKPVRIKNRPEKYHEQIEAQLHNPRTVADNKQGVGNESVAKEAAPRFNRPVSISYVEHRLRLADADGPWTKYVTDALVSAGILRDDSTKEIPKRPSHRQLRVHRDSH